MADQYGSIVLTCKYAKLTGSKWVNNAPCLVVQCSHPDRCKKVPNDKAGFHSRYAIDENGNRRDDIIEVRSIVCNSRQCTGYEKDENE